MEGNFLQVEMQLIQKRIRGDFGPVQRVNQREQCDFLPLRPELLGHFESYRAAHAVSSEKVGSFGLDLSDLFHVQGSHVLDPVEEWMLSIQPLRLQSVDWLVRTQLTPTTPLHHTLAPPSLP